MNAIDILAIIGGLAISFGISMLVAIVIGIAEAVIDSGLLEDETDAEAVEQRMLTRLREDRTFQASVLLLSLLAQMLGGYYTAWWAEAAPLLNAALMGALALVLSHAMDAADITPSWSRWAWMLLALPASMAGAFICCGAG